MAGVTDRPFRQLCREQGAGMAVSEMLIADPSFWKTRKSIHRLNHIGETGPISVQIAGGDANMLATAAKLNQDNGAQLIDINMGCPAKKVCNKAAGSALMKNVALVTEILEKVVQAVDVPVTLKIRTGWDKTQKNALEIARIAELSGIQALAVHGRTRACGYQGSAEYSTVSEIKQSLKIPVFANGDIDSPEKAAQVLKSTQVDGLLIGRAAQGSPWLFNDINYYLKHGVRRAELTLNHKKQIILKHVVELHQFYGEKMGHRIARKHVGWYLKTLHQETVNKETINKDTSYPQNNFRKEFNIIDSPQAQLDAIHNLFEQLLALPSNLGEQAA